MSNPNITTGGNSRQYQIQKLKRDAPDIAISFLKIEQRGRPDLHSHL